MKKLLLLYLCLILWFAVGGNEQANKETDTKPQRPRLILMKITAYDPYDKRCVGRWAGHLKTSIGKNAEVFDGVSADPELLPYGTKLFIPGIGERVVDDTGGAMRKAGRRGLYHIDIRMPTHRQAEKFGMKLSLVEIVEGESPR